MKTLKTNMIMIVIAVLLYACGSDDSNTNPETGEETEIRPISELAEDPDFIEFMELYYFPDTEIPDLQVAYDLFKEYEDQGLFDEMNEQEFGKLAIVFGYEKEINFVNYLEELYHTQKVLEKRYLLNSIDQDILDEVRASVFNDLFEAKRDIFLKNNRQNYLKNSNVIDQFNQCAENDKKEFAENPIIDPQSAPTCTGESEGIVRRIFSDYGYNSDPCQPPKPLTQACIDINILSWRFEMDLMEFRWRCCIYYRCELDESFPGTEDQFCKNPCICS